MSEHKSQPSLAEFDDELDLAKLFRLLWDGKWIVGGFTIFAAVVSVIWVLLLPNIYKAEAVLAPNSQEGGSGLSALAAQYGGLASLAGIDLGSGSPDKTTLGLEVLQSRKFVSDFIQRHDLLVPLIAAKDWDPESGELVIDTDDYDVAAEEWIRDVRSPKKTTPTLQEASEEFFEIMSVAQDKDTGFVTLSIKHYSPHIAKQWVDWLVDDLNSSIMRQDVSEAEQAIAYLNEQISSTSLAELRAVFFNLIEEQMKTVMLAEVSDEYLLKTLDPAVAPEDKSAPKRSLIVLLSVMLGGFIGLIAVIVTSGFRSE